MGDVLISLSKTQDSSRISTAQNEVKLKTKKDGIKNESIGLETVMTMTDNKLSTKLPSPQPCYPGRGASKPRTVAIVLSGAPFESGINTECVQLLRQLSNVQEEVSQFNDKIILILNVFRHLLGPLMYSDEKSKVHNAIGPKHEEFYHWIQLKHVADGLTCLSESASDIERQYIAVFPLRTQCKLVLFAKIQHAKKKLFHSHLAVLHLVHELLLATIEILCHTDKIGSEGGNDNSNERHLHVFQLAEAYNACLKCSWMQRVQGKLSQSENNESPDGGTNRMNAQEISNKVKVYMQVRDVTRNDHSLLRLSSKPFPVAVILQTFAQKRSRIVGKAFASVLMEEPLLSEVEELRKKYEYVFHGEDNQLGTLGRVFPDFPSLLSKGSVKKTEQNGQKLTRSARIKLYSYYHELLWTIVGEFSEDELLWGFHTMIPLVLQPLEKCSLLKKVISQLLKAPQDSSLNYMQSTFLSLSNSLQSFSLLVSWDENVRLGFQTAIKIKRPEQVLVNIRPEGQQWSTDFGKKFGHLIQSSLNLMEEENDMGTQGNPDQTLGDMIQIMFRLEATLLYYMFWTTKRSKVWLNGWSTPQFLATSQRDPNLLLILIKQHEKLFRSPESLLCHESFVVRLSAKHRQLCAREFQVALQKLQDLPNELLNTVGPVCKTLSLATLRSHFPSQNHWKRSGVDGTHDAEKVSSYVFSFIEKVLEPSAKASVALVPSIVQEGMGKQVIHAACDAWLTLIMDRKVKFSEWGALQLLRDFMALRDWIANDSNLEKDAKNAILQLEILKTCEGVAYLLLRKPGDVLGVGKPNRQNRKVAPSSGSEEEGSPTLSKKSAFQDDIPPEMFVTNQQMWLELRLRRSFFSCCN